MLALATTQALGKELLFSSVGTVAHALRHTLGTVVNFLYHEDQFKHLLEDVQDLNLDTDVALIEEIVTELDPQQRCLQLTVKQLHQALDAMHGALKGLHQQMAAHQLLWFSYYRTFDHDLHLQRLRRCKKRMDHQFARLISVRQLFP